MIFFVRFGKFHVGCIGGVREGRKDESQPVTERSGRRVTSIILYKYIAMNDVT